MKNTKGNIHCCLIHNYHKQHSKCKLARNQQSNILSKLDLSTLCCYTHMRTSQEGKDFVGLSHMCKPSHQEHTEFQFYLGYTVYA